MSSIDQTLFQPDSRRVATRSATYQLEVGVNSSHKEAPQLVLHQTLKAASNQSRYRYAAVLCVRQVTMLTEV